MLQAHRPPHTRSANARNLLRLCLLRGILILGLVLAAVFVQAFWGRALLADEGVLAAIGGLTTINLLTFWRLRVRGEVFEAEIFAQLLLDMLLMTLVLYRTGGSTNPFVSYYLVPLTIASATLSLRYTVSLGLMTLASYTLLLVYYVPLDMFAGHGMTLTSDSHVMHMSPHGNMLPAEGAGPRVAPFNLHVFGMWLNFLVSATLISYFVSRMSLALREQDQRLAEQHERLLQKEQIVAMGALAAGAAHELGTPLATMTVLAQDLETDLPADSVLRDDVRILREQLAVCRRILGDLREQAMRPAEIKPQSLAAYGRELLTKMEIIHPSRHFALQAGEGGEQVLRPSLALQQAIMNLLNNAAEASRQEVGVVLAVRGNEFCLDIEDDGPGIDPAVAERLGQPFVSTKPEGLGIGFFLSHASINQMGGSIHLRERPQGGTHTALRLPLASVGGEA